MLFQDRSDAGRRLATELAPYRNRSDVLVLALPRGGVPVALEVARALNTPLDVFLVRKLGVPGHEELAMGAIASGGVRVLNEEVVRELLIAASVIDAATAKERRELERRESAYRDNRPPPEVDGRTVILVDDGLATGSTMHAAVEALRLQNPKRIVIAVPVGAKPTCDGLRLLVEELVCLATPEPFQAVGLWYYDFSQTTDEDVRDLLQAAVQEHSARQLESRDEYSGGGKAKEDDSHDSPEIGASSASVIVPAGSVVLEGNMVLPKDALGIVLFAHGSGSSRHSPRNRYVASRLNESGLATLLIDLLTPSEQTADERIGHLRFDIGLLASRLLSAIDWLSENSTTRDLQVGCFGASTGGGAALVAAAERPHKVGAVVLRGGRPDLAALALPRVQAPTLLIVGGEDRPVITMNQEAVAKMHAHTGLEIVPGASHLFVEEGAMERVADLALDWFTRFLAVGHSNEGPERRAA